MSRLLTTSYGLAWLRAFVFTEIIEAPLYRRVLDVSWGKALAASAITHPFVWFFFPWICSRLRVGYLPQAIVSEVFAWLVEAVFFRVAAKIPMKRALVVSLLVNLASVTLGLLSRRLFGAP